MSKKLPIVAIVGRRNVGKSTLFNALCKEKKAIVDDIPGLTRDIISYTVSHEGIHFSLSDTPGLDLPNSSELSAPIIENAMNHLKEASVIVFLLENPAPDSFDIELASILRKINLPVIIAVNKMDHPEYLENMDSFYEIGFTDFLPISSKRKVNLDMLLSRILSLLPAQKTTVKEPDINISIVGRPNAGKSTLLNALIGFNRSIVSEIPGTTRDSVDEVFTYHEQTIRMIDTAGMRRKRKITENVEYYSMTRTIESIERSDVVVHLLDAELGLTETDKKIFDEILKAHKPMILAINKWDKLDKNTDTFKDYTDKLIHKLYRAEDFPIISISASEKKRISKIIDTCFNLHERAKKRVETPRFNRVLQKLLQSRRLPQIGSKLRVYYGTQIDTVPPKFKLFVNNKEFFKKDIIRYFEKNLQKELDLFGIPVWIDLEGKVHNENRSKVKSKPKANSKYKPKKKK